MKNFLGKIPQLLFETAYCVLGAIGILWVSISLQAGSSGIYLFIVNDLVTDTQRLWFSLCFPMAYFISLLVLNYILGIPRFDFFNRIVAINLLLYTVVGLTLSALRLPLISREVFFWEFFTSGILLVAYYKCKHGFFPRCLGVLPDVDITPFKVYPSLRAVPFDSNSIPDDSIHGVVTKLGSAVSNDTTHLLASLAQKRIPIFKEDALIEILWGRVPLANLTTVEVESFVPPIIYGHFKRISEVMLILLFSPILIAISLITASAIKIDSPGPILFSQKRSGLNGIPFTMFKFRSMYISDEKTNSFAKVNDKRVTRVGRVLRRLRLDEIPQFWNIILGDMSLIGPRPEQLEFTNRFGRLIPFYGFRHTVRPGLTGWAQVMYGYAASDEATSKKLEFDFFYIKHMSAWLDLVVIVKTLRTIVLGGGAR